MLTFAREQFQKIFDEMLPLIEAHYQEIAWRQDQIPLAVDYDRYCQLADAGILMCFTARKGRWLVGYAVFMVMPHLHYNTTKMAINDVVFLAQAYRNKGEGAALIEFSEKELKALGCQVVTLHVKPQLDWGPLCANMGYELGDRIWMKWIGD